MSETRYDDLRALFVNGTLKRSPEPSNTDGLVRISSGILRNQRSEWDAGCRFDFENPDDR